MAEGFDSDFAKGEREAARLVSRMEQALKRAEEFQRQAQKDAQLARRSGARPGEGTTEATSGDRVRRRLDDEKAITNQARERERLLQRETQAMGAQERALRRIRAVGPSAYTQGVLQGPGSVPPNRRLPPGPPGGYGYQRQLPPGPPPPRQLPAGRAPLGLPRPGETVGGSRYYEYEAKAASGAARASEQYQRAQQAASTENVRFGRTLGQNLFIQQQANTQYQRFGALSSEWIAATARGSTTIQELGRQTTATIGKFGGWLAAGSLLFTALGAVRAIGHGAIESASGVNQLQRVINNVDPGTAQAGFRRYSQEFNLPIGDVSQAAYEMGKIFHDQNDALEASKAVLYSVKVGELDTATASRYLIAIINGFHLPAQQMVTVFDQLNGAQNKFGISINDVEAGLAKASGSFNAATTKGSPLDKYHELLALITTAQKATGQTGQVVGTAIQRAPNFLRQTKNQNILKKYGIEAGGDLNQIINEAFKVAQGLSGHQIGELAAAIFGPQYGARIGTPLLQQFDLYKKVFEGTSRDKTRNSGQRELNTLLHSMREELSKIITEIEVIGSSLAQAGFLDIFGTGIILLGQLLSGVNDLLELFNSLPAPLTHTLAIMLELYGVVKLLRKFNVGDSFAAGSLGRRAFSGPDREKRLLQESYTGQVGFLTEERDRAATKASRSTTAVRVAQARVLQEEERLATIVGGQGAASEAALAQERNVVRAQLGLNSATEAKLAAELAEEEILLTQIAVEDKKAALATARNDAEARALAARYGDIIPPNFSQGAGVSGRAAAEARGYRVVTDTAGNPSLVRGGGASAAAGAAAAKAAEQSAREAEVGLRGAGGAWRNLARTEVSLREPGRTYQQAAGRAATALTASGAAIGGAVTTVRGVGPKLVQVGSRLRALGSGFYSLIGGPLGLLIAGAYVAIEYGDDLGRALAGGQDVIDRMNSYETEHVTTGSENKSFVRKYEQLAKQAGVSLKQLQTQFPSLHIDGLPEYFDAEEAYLQHLEERNQRVAHKQGRGARNLFPDQLRQQVQGLSDYNAGSGKFGDEFRRVQEELRSANAASDPKELKAVRHELEQVGAKALNQSSAVTGFFTQYQSIADKLLEKQIKNLSTLVQGGPTFASRKDVGALVRASLVRGIRDLQSPKASIQAKGQQTLAELPDALEAYASAELKTSLSLAQTQDERNAAYDHYLNSVRASANQVRTTFGRNRKHLVDQLQKTQADLRQAFKEGKGGYQSDYKGGPSYGVEPSRAPDPIIEKLKQRAASLHKAIGNLDKSQRYELRQLRALIAEQEREQLQEQVSAIQEIGQIKQARIGGSDPVGQARVGLRAAERALSLIRSTKAAQPQEVRQALLAVLNAREELGEAVRQEARDLADATQQLAQARAQGDPVRQAQADIAKAHADLQLARTVAEKRTAMAEMIEAQNSLDKAYAEIALARLQLKAAETDDPVKQARIKLQEANVQLKYAKGPLERLEAQTAKQQAVRDKRDAVAQARIEDIEFQADIGRITHDQEIAAYESLLHTLTLSRDARRNLRRKIHDLRNEASSEFELTVGDIALPTIYDIRRAIGSGSPNAAQYNDQSQTTVHIHVNGGEKNALYREMDNALKRNNRSARRSAGHIPQR